MVFGREARGESVERMQGSGQRATGSGLRISECGLRKGEDTRFHRLQTGATTKKCRKPRRRKLKAESREGFIGWKPVPHSGGFTGWKPVSQRRKLEPRPIHHELGLHPGGQACAAWHSREVVARIGPARKLSMSHEHKGGTRHGLWHHMGGRLGRGIGKSGNLRVGTGHGGGGEPISEVLNRDPPDADG